MAANGTKKHHYVPQFYMGRFACADDENKVMVLERHRDFVVADRKSIDGIGYEEHLHDYDDNGAPASIEGDLNKAIETPFSQSTSEPRTIMPRDNFSLPIKTELSLRAAHFCIESPLPAAHRRPALGPTAGTSDGSCCPYLRRGSRRPAL